MPGSFLAVAQPLEVELAAVLAHGVARRVLLAAVRVEALEGVVAFLVDIDNVDTSCNIFNRRKVTQLSPKSSFVKTILPRQDY